MLGAAGTGPDVIDSGLGERDLQRSRSRPVGEIGPVDVGPVFQMVLEGVTGRAFRIRGEVGRRHSHRPGHVTGDGGADDDLVDDDGSVVEIASGGDVEAPAELDPEAIVAAALLIASGGDLEGAISARIVSEAEAEAAIAALEAGTLPDLFDWASRVERGRPSQSRGTP